MSEKIKLEVNHSKHQGNKPPQQKEQPKQEPPKQEPTKQPKGNQKGSQLPNSNASSNLKEQKSASEKPKGQTIIQPTADKKGSTNEKQSAANKPSEKKLDPKALNQKAGVDPKAKGKTLEPIKQLPRPVVYQIQQSKRRISHNLEELLGEYKQMASLDFENHGHNPQKEEMIKNLIHNFKQEKKERWLRQRQQKRLEKEKQKLKQQAQERREKEERIKAQKKLIQSIDERKKQSEQRRQQHEKRIKEVVEISKKQVLYKQKEQEFKALKKDQECELELKLAKHSQKFEPMNEQEIQAHIEEYEQRMLDYKQNREQKAMDLHRQIDQQNDFLREIWKGDCHRVAYIERKMMWHEKFRPKQQAAKVKQYRDLIREKNRQQISKKQEELQQKQSSVASQEAQSQVVDCKGRFKHRDGRKVPRYKFVKGVAAGETVEVLPMKRSEEEQRELGNNYLQYLRNLPKRKLSKSNSHSEDEKRATNATDPKKPRKQPLQHYVREVNPLYSGRRSERLGRDNSPYHLNSIFTRLRNSDDMIDKEQRLLKHQHLPSVVDYHDRQKRINEKLFKSVQHKISLLNHMVSV